MSRRSFKQSGPDKKSLPDRSPQPRDIRIDKLLWFLRFARTRTMAKRLSEKGHVRLNGRRVDRAHASVKIGDILTVPQGKDVHVIRIAALPNRRAGADTAKQCFEALQTGD